MLQHITFISYWNEIEIYVKLISDVAFYVWLIACQDNCSPDFTLTEVRQAVSKLKSGNV